MIALQPSMVGLPSPGRRSAVAWVFAVAYVVCVVVDLTVELIGLDTVALITQAMAMPLLACALVAAVRRLDRMTGPVLVALIFSWLGDTVGNHDLLVKLGLFLLAQLAYVVAFWPRRHVSLLFRPWALVGYGALFLAMVAILLPRTEALAVPVVVYGLCVVLMAVLASGLGRQGAIGGLFFVISDSILGTKWFYHSADTTNMIDFSIMFSYLLAQGLLVAAVVLDRRRYRR